MILNDSKACELRGQFISVSKFSFNYRNTIRPLDVRMLRTKCIFCTDILLLAANSCHCKSQIRLRITEIRALGYRVLLQVKVERKNFNLIGEIY